MDKVSLVNRVQSYIMPFLPWFPIHCKETQPIPNLLMSSRCFEKQLVYLCLAKKQFRLACTIFILYLTVYVVIARPERERERERERELGRLFNGDQEVMSSVVKSDRSVKVRFELKFSLLTYH